MEALQRHMDQVHKMYYCALCLNNKPVFTFEQEMFKKQELRMHTDRHHHRCEHCPNEIFYDYDALYRHYRDKHFLCELCKKMGKKKRNKRTGAVEYEVYADAAALRAHCNRKHYTCKKRQCEGLAFPDATMLANHMLLVHGE